MHGCTVIGVDPGASGGIAVLWQEGGWDGGKGSAWEVCTYPMPVSCTRILEIFQYHVNQARERGQRVYAALEKVGGFLDQRQVGGEGKRNMASGHTMFSFGASFGRLEMALIAVGIPIDNIEQVSPGRWQRGVGAPVREKGVSQSLWKGVLKEYARSLYSAKDFPDLRINLKTCDALLIATYMRIQRG